MSSVSGTLNAGLGSSTTYLEDTLEASLAVSFSVTGTSIKIGWPLGAIGGITGFQIFNGPDYSTQGGYGFEITADGYSSPVPGTLNLYASINGTLVSGVNGEMIPYSGTGLDIGDQASFGFTGTIITKQITGGPGNYEFSGDVVINFPNSTATWTNVPLGFAESVTDETGMLQGFLIGQSDAICIVANAEVDPLTDYLGTLTLNALVPTVNVPLDLSGNNYYVLSSALEYQVDEIGPWLAVDPFAQGYSWTGGGPTAQPGAHSVQVRDATNNNILSNLQSYYLSAITLNPVSAVAYVAPDIGGFDYEPGVAGAMQYQLNGVGPWIAIPNFVPATEPDGTWTGNGPALPPGDYQIQVRNTATPATVSNPASYVISQNGGSYPTLPVWTVQPDWKSGLTERLEWLTDILTSQVGAEQRLALRETPRRSLEMQITIFSTERALYDLALKSQGYSDWYVPVWTDLVRLQSVLPPAVTLDGVLQPSTFAVDTAGHEYFPGGLLILFGGAFSYEIVVIDSVTSDLVTLAAAPLASWPAGTRVMPLMHASLAQEPTAKRAADAALTSAVQWMSKTSNPFPPSTAGMDTYQGYPVLTTAPDESSAMSYKFDRLVTEIDSKVGLRAVADTAGFGFSSQQFAWFIVGYAALAAMRSFFYALAGRQANLWVPTFYRDLELVLPLAASSVNLTVKQCGYTAFNCAQLSGRQNIRIELTNGTSIYCAIASSVVAGQNEIITLAAPVGSDLALCQVLRVSFMALCRQDTDQIEFAHQAAGGVVTCTSVLREAPNLRVPFWNILDPAKTTGGKVSQSGAYFRNSVSDGQVMSKSVGGKGAGQWFVECAMSVSAIGGVAGFGFATLAATLADVLNTATSSAMMQFGGGGIDANVNGELQGVLPSLVEPLEVVTYFGAAIDLDANLVWFITEFDQTTPIYNDNPAANPATGAGGFDVSWRGENELYLCVQLDVVNGAPSNAVVNAGQFQPFNQPPIGYWPGWSYP